MPDISSIAQVCLVFHLRRAARAASQALDRALSHLGLQASQFTLLSAVAADGPCRAGDLARQLAMDRSTLNRNLGPLLRRGVIVVAGGRGRRGLTVALTPLGEELLAEAAGRWQDVQQRLATDIGESDAGRLLTLLGRISTPPND